MRKGIPENKSAVGMQEAQDRRKAGKGRKLDRKVGFAGCSGKVIRIEMRRRPTTQYPRVVHLESCPGCGHGHDINPMWRLWNESLDAGKEVLRLSA